ncbi:bestrophin family protein [Chitinimonas sp.]|uniref:bestrophin family protein n=1 Tax=Chitinimonas sp. TaxID=1934313 RepID=UPI002F92F777
MIVRPRPHWLRLLFVWRGSVLPRILPQLLLVMGLAVAVVLSHGELADRKVTLTATPFTLIGIALAIFLGFRNNASYDRYWEARKLWGAMLVESRALARQLLTLTSLPPAHSRRLIHLVIACVHALKLQLREQADTSPLAQWLSPVQFARLQDSSSKPTQILLLLGEELRQLRRDGLLSEWLAPALERHIDGLGEAIGGCERIAGTPLPFTYGVMLHRTVYLFCCLLPFGLVDSIGIMTPIMVGFMAYTFFALEAIGEEIEEPFGTMANDLPLDALATNIELNLRELCGETDLPSPPTAVNYILR